MGLVRSRQGYCTHSDLLKAWVRALALYFFPTPTQLWKAKGGTDFPVTLVKPTHICEPQFHLSKSPPPESWGGQITSGA